MRCSLLLVCKRCSNSGFIGTPRCSAARSDGQGKREGTAMSDATFRCDAPTMSFYHVAGNSKAQTTPAAARANEVSFRAGTVGFIKAFKDARQLFWPDTYACITDKKAL